MVRFGRNSDRPRLALRAVEPERGVGVAEDLFRGRVPAEGLPQPVAKVGEVADGDGATTDLDIADRPLARKRRSIKPPRRKARQEELAADQHGFSRRSRLAARQKFGGRSLGFHRSWLPKASRCFPPEICANPLNLRMDFSSPWPSVLFRGLCCFLPFAALAS